MGNKIHHQVGIFAFSVFFLGCATAPVRAQSMVSSTTQNVSSDPIVLFKEFSKIYRPSEKESQAIAFLRAKFEVAKKLWPKNNQPTWQNDTYGEGNVLIRLPGTLKNKTTKNTVALQGHMDMVLDVAGVTSGTDLTPYFINGIDLVEQDGWIHARDFKTTLGADNGIGVAMLLRYLLDPRLEHPPLELIFTVQEEIGMRGAGNFGLELNANYFINLDMDEVGRVFHGCLGSERRSVTESVALANLTSDKATLKINVNGLKGGHSGLEIHFDRLNSIKAMAIAMEEVQKLFGDFNVVKAEGGNFKILNKIPRSFELEIVLHHDTLNEQDLQRLVAALRSRIAVFKEEDATAVNIEVLPGTVAAGTRVLSIDDTMILMRALNDIPNGPIMPPPDTAFEKNLGTTSNMGFFKLDTAASQAQFAFMARGLITKEIEEALAKVVAAVDSISPSDATFATITTSPAWYLDGGDPFIAAAVTSFTGKFGNHVVTTGIAAGGLESAWFSKKFPKMKLVSVGPHLVGIHSSSEKMEVKSVYQTVDALDNFLKTL